MLSVRWAFNYSLWKPSKEEWILSSRCIQREERERIRRFCFTRDAKASMIGRLMMRKMVCNTFGVKNNEIKFERSEKGKPILAKGLKMPKDIPAFDFNVSHQGSYSVLAADCLRKVGVDVMKIEYTGGKPLLDFFKLMKRQFSVPEWSFILIPRLEKDQLSRFIRLWCLKESYVKAEGIGIGFDLQRLSFQCRTPVVQKGQLVTDTQLFVDGRLCGGWLFEESLLGDDHCVAVALETKTNMEVSNALANQSPSFTHVTFQDLMEGALPLFKEDEDDEKLWQEFASKMEVPR